MVGSFAFAGPSRSAGLGFSNPVGQVRCSITPQSPLYTLGEPILATLTIANDSNVPSKVNLGFNREGGFLFSMRSPTGAVLDAPQIPGRDGLSLPSTVIIKPNDTYSKQILLNDWFAFRETGIHNITWSLAPPPPNSTSSLCATETIYIDVAPFNVMRLRQVSETLVTIISDDDKDYAKAADAAKALKAIKRPSRL